MMKRPTATLAIATTVFAQEGRDAPIEEERQVSLGLGIPKSLNFHGHAGVAAGLSPDYEGSDSFSAAALPLVDIRQPDFLFLKGASVNPNDGLASIGWNALNFGYSQGAGRKLHISVGPLARYHNGRDEDDNNALSGLGDIDDNIGFGGFIEANAGPWSAGLTAVPQDAGGSEDGLLVAVDTKYTAQLSKQLALTTGVSTSWGDDDYMQGFYGISSNQALRSGLARFNADAGFKDIGAQVRTTYALSSNWMVDGQLGYQRLLNDAAESPIVDTRGSRNQFRALLGVAYQF